MPRYNGFTQRNAAPPPFFDEDFAAGLVTLPDSWTFQVEGVPTAAAIGGAPPSVTMPANLDLTPIPTLPGDSRVVLFDVTGRFSRVRAITSINTGTNVVEFDPLVDPATFSLGQVRIESQDRRYTWLLTVRNRGAGRAAVDVVVFFRRAPSLEDEAVHGAFFFEYNVGPDGQPGVAGADDDDNGTVDDDSERGPGIWVGPDGQPGDAGVDDDGNGHIDTLPSGALDTRELGWPGTDDVRSDDERNRVVENVDVTNKPYLRKGGFVFDVENAYWYRVQDVQDVGPGLVNVTVDRDIRKDGSSGAIFMRSVVEAYSIGTKSIP